MIWDGPGCEGVMKHTPLSLACVRARESAPSSLSCPKLYTFFIPPIGMVHFGIVFRSYLSGIPEIPLVPFCQILCHRNIQNPCGSKLAHQMSKHIVYKIEAEKKLIILGF